MSADDGGTRFDPAPQDLVMTMFGAYFEPPREARPVWAGGLVGLLSELGFSEGAARIALTRLVNRELLDRRRDGRHVCYLLSGRARAVLAEGDRRIFTLGRSTRGSEEWTTLWHSIPDGHRSAREVLVRRLKFLGFGSIQDGTWIAPRDRLSEVSRMLTELGVREHAGLLLGRPAGETDARNLMQRAWDLDGLAKAYARFSEEFEGYRSPRVRAELDDRASFAVRTRLVHRFRQFPFLDPELPESLVPPPARRATAVEVFHDLYEALAPAAQRHFDEVTSQP